MGMKKLAALVMALMLCLTAVSAMAAEAKIGNTEYGTVKEAFNNANQSLFGCRDDRNHSASAERFHNKEECALSSVQ